MFSKTFGFKKKKSSKFFWSFPKNKDANENENKYVNKKHIKNDRFKDKVFINKTNNFISPNEYNKKNNFFNNLEKNPNEFIQKKRLSPDINNNICNINNDISYISSISDYKNIILENIKNKDIIIISGNTGCGKSTQIPQYIYNDDKNKKILITQPRRISTISIANRIAKEMGLELGDIVGYQVRMESKINDKKTRIFIKTNGIFFEELIHNKSLQYSYIILDEIHESDIYNEILISIFKDYFSKKKNISFKLIIMSASIEINNYLNYFISDKIKKDKISFIDIKCNTNYKIDEYYLGQLYDILRNKHDVSEDIKENLQTINENMKNSFNNNKLFLYKKPVFIKELCVFVIGILESIEYAYNPNNSGVLIFLPGIEQIKYLKNYIINYTQKTNRLKNFNIIVLHSVLNFKEQNKLFENNKDSMNLILATNIIESSITIPNLNFVIDFCLVKQVNYDEDKNIKYLELNWISKVNYIQRKGRVGRISKGTYIKLIPESLFVQLDVVPKAEILSKSLETLILKLYLYTNSFTNTVDIIENCLNKPSKIVINNSFEILENMGSIIKNNIENEFVNSNERNNSLKKIEYDYILTNVGRIYSELTLEIKYSRLIVISYTLGHINLGIALASILSQEKSIFINSINNYDNYITKLKYSEGQENDFIIIYNLYKDWYNQFKDYYLNEKINNYDNIDLNEKKDLKNYLNQNFLDIYVLNNILRTEILIKKKLTALNLFNINFDAFENDILSFDKNNLLILNTILVGTFYNQIYSPHYQYLEKIGPYIIQDKNNDTNLNILQIEYNNTNKDLDIALNYIVGEKEYELLYFDKNKYNIKFKTQENLQKLLLSVYYDIDINENKKYYYLDYLDVYNNIKSIKFENNFKYDYNLKYTIDSNCEEIVQNKNSINYINIYSNYDKLRNTKFITNDFIFKSYIRDSIEKSFITYSKNSAVLSSELINLIILVYAPKYKLNKNESYSNEYKSININKLEINFDYIITNFHILIVNNLRKLINNIINFGIDNENKFNYDKKDVELLENKLQIALFDDYIRNDEYKKLYQEIKQQILFLLNNVKLIRNLKRKKFIEVYNYTYSIKKYKFKYFTDDIKIKYKYFGLNLKSQLFKPFDGYLNEIKELGKKFKENDFLQLINPLYNIKEYYVNIAETNNFIDAHNNRIKNLYYNFNKLLEYLKDILLYMDCFILCPECKSEICKIDKNLKIIDNNIIKYIPSYLNTVNKTKKYSFPNDFNNKISVLFETIGIKIENYLYCRNKHLIGYTKNKDVYYYIYINGNIFIKYPDLSEENICINKKNEIFTIFNDIKDKAKKIKEIKCKESFIKKINCKLCGIGFNTYGDIITHVSGSLHINNMQQLLNEII